MIKVQVEREPRISRQDIIWLKKKLIGETWKENGARQRKCGQTYEPNQKQGKSLQLFRSKLMNVLIDYDNEK